MGDRKNERGNDTAKLLANMDLKITTDNPPTKAAPRTPRKPSVFDEALHDSAATSSWKRFEIPRSMVKKTRYEVIRSARSLDMKVTTRTDPIESVGEPMTALYFKTTLMSN